MSEKKQIKIKAKLNRVTPLDVDIEAMPLLNYGKQTITITYGECAENHVGMQKLGSICNKGLTIADLKKAELFFTDRGLQTELIMLGKDLDKSINSEDASVLIIRNGVSGFGCNADDMYREQKTLKPDTKAKMRGSVVNKHARYNLCFDEIEQEPNYEEGKGRVVQFSDVPLLDKVRHGIADIFPHIPPLKAEGNYYYDVNKCGIGYHGDTERKIVVAVRLGHTMSMHYWWYHRSSRVGDRIDLELQHGDIYMMSEKATGCDWKKSSKYTLRHAAGCSKYTS